MSFPGLPYDVLFPILMKTSTKTQCRFRQTSKKADEFVERNRFRFSNRQETNQLVLQILNTETDTFEITVQEGMNSSAFGFNYTYGYEDDKLRLKGGIEDSFKQVSGFTFNTVVVKPINSSAKEPFEISSKALGAILGKLKLKCDHFYVEGFFNPGEILPLVRFTKLSTHYQNSEFISEEMLQYMNCAHINMSTKEMASSLSLSTVVRNFVSFTYSPLDPYDSTFTKMLEFIEETKTNRSARGILKHLNMYLGDTELPSLLELLPGSSELWEGPDLMNYDFPNVDATRINSCVYKLKIAGGCAVIFQDAYEYHVYFLDDCSRMSIYDVMIQQMFPKSPIDASDLFNIAQIEDDGQAYNALKAFIQPIHSLYHSDGYY